MILKLRTFSFIIFILLTVAPLLVGVGYALLYSVGLVGLLNTGFTLENWIKVLTDEAFWRSLGFSFYIAFITILISASLAMAAVVRVGAWFRRGTLSFMIYLPLVFPAMVMGFYTFQLLSKAGILSRIGFQLNIIQEVNNFPDLVNDTWGIGIIFAHVCMATPFLLILFNNLYQNERLEAYANLAKTLGATQGQITWRVLIPVLLNKAFATLLLYFIFVMSAYEIPLLLGSQSRQMVSVFTIQKLQRFNLEDMPQAYVVSVVYTVLIMIMLIVLLSKRMNKSHF